MFFFESSTISKTVQKRYETANSCFFPKILIVYRMKINKKTSIYIRTGA